jgi:glycosyltransferase involved in cell wall biosynthesis
MRILVLNWRDPKNPEAGGAEIHLHEILRRAVVAGHEIVQVSHEVEGLPPVESIDGVEIHRHGKWYSFNLSLRHYCKKLDLTSFDLVVEDLCKLPFFSPRWTDTPVMVIVPHLFGTTAYREVSYPKALYTNLLERFIPSVYAGCPFVAISESTKLDLIRRGIPGESIEVVPCGIDTDFYTPLEGISPEQDLLLFVGRLKKYKGIQFLLAALALLRENGRSLRLVVLGSGDYRDDLVRIAESLDLSDTVDFPGFVSQEEKLSLLRRSWAAVFPSEKEGWGLTVIEANCCGTPVIASDSDGLRDSVSDRETGLLVPHGDIEALAAAILELCDDPRLRSELSRNCLNWGRSFSWDVTGDLMIALMEKAAGLQNPL